jgi:hypothetical protein
LDANQYGKVSGETGPRARAFVTMRTRWPVS